MNHANQYSNLITKAIIRQWSDRPLTGYFENHHICPRSMGGKDNDDNLVQLTFKEHYIAHLLLAHMPGSDTQWASVAAILADTANPRSPRYCAIRFKRWVRKNIALKRAEWTREASKRKLQQQHKLRQLTIEQAFISDLFDLAGVGRE